MIFTWKDQSCYSRVNSFARASFKSKWDSLPSLEEALRKQEWTYRPLQSCSSNHLKYQIFEIIRSNGTSKVDLRNEILVSCNGFERSSEFLLCCLRGLNHLDRSPVFIPRPRWKPFSGHCTQRIPPTATNTYVIWILEELTLNSVNAFSIVVSNVTLQQRKPAIAFSSWIPERTLTTLISITGGSGWRWRRRRNDDWNRNEEWSTTTTSASSWRMVRSMDQMN